MKRIFSIAVMSLLLAFCTLAENRSEQQSLPAPLNFGQPSQASETAQHIDILKKQQIQTVQTVERHRRQARIDADQAREAVRLPILQADARQEKIRQSRLEVDKAMSRTLLQSPARKQPAKMEGGAATGVLQRGFTPVGNQDNQPWGAFGDDLRLDGFNIMYGKDPDRLSKIGSQTYIYDGDGRRTGTETTITSYKQELNDLFFSISYDIPEGTTIKLVDNYTDNYSEYSLRYLDAASGQWVDLELSVREYRDGELIYAIRSARDNKGNNVVTSKTESEFDGQGRVLVTISYFNQSLSGQAGSSLTPSSRTEYNYRQDGLTEKTESYWRDSSWVYNRRYAYGTDINGQEVSEDYYIRNGAWQGSYKSSNYKPDSLTSVSQSWNWDSENQDWVLSSKTVNHYDTAGRQIEQESYNYSRNLQDLYLYSRYGRDYNQDGEDIGSWTIRYQEPDSAGLEPSIYYGNKNSYEDYDFGEQRYNISYKLDEKGQWIPVQKEEYEWTAFRDSSFWNNEMHYSDNYKYKQIVRYSWDAESSSWKEGTTQKYEYDDHASTILSEEYEGGELRRSDRYRYRYVNDRQYTLLSESYSSYNGYVRHYKYEYDYDGNGRQTMSAYFTWDDVSSSWIGSYKDEITYNDQGDYLLQISYQWNRETGSWFGTSKSVRDYDQAGNLTKDELYYGSPSADSTRWTGSYASYKTYNQAGVIEEQTDLYSWNSSTDNWGHGQKTVSRSTADGQPAETATYTWTDGTWAGQTRETYDYDSQGHQTAHVIYSWESTSQTWTAVDKTETSYLASGQMKDAFSYRYDATAQSWTPYSRHVAEVTDGQITSWLESRYDGGTWTSLKKGEYTYDAADSCFTLVEYDFQGWNGTWAASLRQRYRLDEQGRRVFEEYYDRNGEDWTGRNKYEYAYDDKGRIVMNTQYNWDYETGGWKGSLKSERDYDENGYQTLSAEYRCTDEGLWYGTERQEKFYTADGREYGHAYYSWNDITSAWYGYSRSEQLLDARGKTILEGYYNWDDSHNDWYGQYRNEYRYDDQGRRILQISQEWDWENWCWIGSEKDENVFDEQGRAVLSSYLYGWADGDWANGSKSVFAFDDNDNEILSEYYNWEDGHWVGSSKREWGYDEKGEQTMSAYYSWDDDARVWVGENKNEYGSNEKGERTIASYSWNGQTQTWEGQSKTVYLTEEILDWGERNGSIEYEWFNGEWLPASRTTEEIHYRADGNYDYNTLTLELYKNGQWIVDRQIKTVCVYSRISGLNAPVALAKVSAAQGRIRIEAEAQTRSSVHDMDGRLVATAVGTTEIRVPAGVYLIRIEDQVLKISVR